ncbi:MAG: hypothetical protein EA411_08605 [Saprospirales bacterium]|nr:MAG: hypothetical protein EA411_08605 [Saprospirales bacterium]
MTVQEFFELLSHYPAAVLAFFLCIPASTLLANYLSGTRAADSPWKYLYSVLIYLACVPGIFSMTLMAYQFLFETLGVMQLDIILHILPLVSMILTILIIRKKVNLDLIPGFDKITAFLTVIFVVFVLLWVLDRTRLWVITFLPLPVALLIFFAMLVALIWAWRKLGGKGAGRSSRH